MRPRSALLLLTSLLLAPIPADAWNAATHERVIVNALQLMPPVLQNQLLRHRDQLLAGALEPDKISAPNAHSLNADGSEAVLHLAVEREIASLVQILATQGSFADVARAFGRISHYSADATFPLNTSRSDAREAQYFNDYAAYAGSKLGRYPAIFNGYGPVSQAGFSPEAYLRAVAERANQSYPIVSRAYFPDSGAMRSSRTFDDRGPVFGVTQLAFIDAVSVTANIWLHAWREAHGDLAGTPHFAAVPRTAPRAQNLPSAAKRP